MELKTARTTCPYCAVGCNLVLTAVDGEVIGVLPAKEGPTNEGTLCIKGWNVGEFVQCEDRLKAPLVRRNGTLQASTWDEALDHAASELRRVKETHGPESIEFVASARCINEETY